MTDQAEQLKNKILNEGSLPKRKLLVDDLEELSYKRGFKEAEQIGHSELRKELEQILSQWEHPSLAPRWIHERLDQLRKRGDV